SKKRKVEVELSDEEDGEDDDIVLKALKEARKTSVVNNEPLQSSVSIKRNGKIYYGKSDQGPPPNAKIYFELRIFEDLEDLHNQEEERWRAQTGKVTLYLGPGRLYNTLTQFIGDCIGEVRAETPFRAFTPSARP